MQGRVVTTVGRESQLQGTTVCIAAQGDVCTGRQGAQACRVGWWRAAVPTAPVLPKVTRGPCKACFVPCCVGPFWRHSTAVGRCRAGAQGRGSRVGCRSGRACLPGKLMRTACAGRRGSGRTGGRRAAGAASSCQRGGWSVQRAVWYCMLGRQSQQLCYTPPLSGASRNKLVHSCHRDRRLHGDCLQRRGLCA